MDNNKLPKPIDPGETFMKMVTSKEEEVLNAALTRFCIAKGGKIDISRVDFRTWDHRPNYIEYYYMGLVRNSKENKHILMSRELKIVQGQELPVLEILFGKHKESELSKCYF